jgi:hypothetical protein
MASTVKQIGLGFDGSTVWVQIGRLLLPALTLEGGDSLEGSMLPYMGIQGNSEQTPGSYKSEDHKTKFTAPIWYAVVLPALGNTFGNLFLPIVAGNSHPQIGTTSVLLWNARIMKTMIKLANDNKAQEIETSGHVQQYFHGTGRYTINNPTGSGYTGSSGF